jgi:predicted RND superfamily exporter protein
MNRNKTGFGRAILGIIITVIIAAVGFSTYDDGGYMEWFGIELSFGVFIALICAFLLFDIYAVASAVKRRREAEAAAQSAVAPPPPDQKQF